MGTSADIGTRSSSDRGSSAPAQRGHLSSPLTSNSSPATLKPRSDDRQIARHGSWAIASDGIQWIVENYHGNRWRPLKFARSTRTILARCLREAGASPAEVEALIKGLPEQFNDNSKGT